VPETSAPGPAPQSKGPGLEAEVVLMTPNGFEPASITRTAGPFILMVHNHLPSSQMIIKLSPLAGGPAVREVPFPKEQYRWSDLVDLAPGIYNLTDELHASVCRITIKQ
jgi:hypothetical protein